MITNPDELDRTIESAFDGTASEEELHALRETLRADPAARDRYYEQAGLHQALSHRFSHGSGSETARLLANARLQAQMRRNGRLALFAAAAVFVLAVILLQTIFLPGPEPVVLFETARGSKFTVRHASPDTKRDAGELGEDSLVKLSQGSLELRFRGGSRAVVLGPATFNLHSERKLHLVHGTAWFHISEEDRGFEVSTPGLHIADLGAEFGVITGPAAADEIHVFKGRVITRSLNPFHHEETLSAGQSRMADPAGLLKPLASRSEAFLVRLPETTSDGLIANGGFESGAAPAGVRYGQSATQAMLAGWRFGREIGVVKPSAEGRWAARGSINNHFPLHFGKSPGDERSSLKLNGYLDDVAIWSGALSQSEIEALWDRGTGRAAASIFGPATLMSNWTFDSDLADHIGSKDATAFGNAGFQTATSKIGAGAAVFDGLGGYMTAGTRKDFAVETGALSVSFWFKVNDEEKGLSKRLLATGAGLENQEGWCFFMDPSAPQGDRIGAAMSDGTGRSVQKGNANRTVDPFDGKWHLAVAVFDAATATVSNYLDSIQEATTTPDLLNGGAIGVNVLTIFSSTADRQVGFHAAARGRPNPEDASIYQSFRTEPGREYEVEFEMGGIFFHNAQVEVTASVHDGVGPRDKPLAKHVERRSRQSGNGYNPPARFHFVAASSITTLVFTETSNDSQNADPVLDNVMVRAVDGA
jgi:ferric-dicitrate binding protein FerR (iron transport regulator)